VSGQTRNLRSVLRTAGCRITGQRKLLLELMQIHSGHLDAHELYRLARERDPRLSLSTIYRTLGLLHELGLVNELHLGEEHHHYEIAPAAAHHHLVCASCGKIVEFGSSLTEKLTAAVAREHNFEITEASIDLTGYCADCRAARRRGEAANPQS